MVVLRLKFGTCLPSLVTSTYQTPVSDRAGYRIWRAAVPEPTGRAAAADCRPGLIRYTR